MIFKIPKNVCWHWIERVKEKDKIRARTKRPNLIKKGYFKFNMFKNKNTEKSNYEIPASMDFFVRWVLWKSCRCNNELLTPSCGVSTSISSSESSVSFSEELHEFNGFHKAPSIIFPPPVGNVSKGVTPVISMQVLVVMPSAHSLSVKLMSRFLPWWCVLHEVSSPKALLLSVDDHMQSDLIGLLSQFMNLTSSLLRSSSNGSRGWHDPDSVASMFESIRKSRSAKLSPFEVVRKSSASLTSIDLVIPMFVSCWPIKKSSSLMQPTLEICRDRSSRKENGLCKSSIVLFSLLMVTSWLR